MKVSKADVLLGKRLRTGGLRRVHFQLADRCNHTCKHCYQVQGHKGELTTEQVKKALDAFAAQGVLFLTLSGGEVTLRNDLLDIAGYARALGMALTIYTNGFSMTRELAQALARLAVWRVHVSVYGAGPSTHDAVTNVPGSFERTLRGIEYLREAGVNVVMKTPIMSSNHHEIGAIRAIAVRLGCSLGISNEMNAREDGALDPVALNPTLTEETLFVGGEGATRSFTPATIEESRRTRSCSVARTGLTVEPNGEVRACTALTVPLGNALRDDPKAIFEGEVAQFLRSLDNSKLHGCRDCDLVPGCTRCHGNAIHEVGDALGPYPSACERAVAHYAAFVGHSVTLRSGNVEASARAPTGPFRIVGEGVLERMPDVRTEDDEAVARRFPWLRPSKESIQARLGAPEGESLVQLRVRRSHDASASEHDTLQARPGSIPLPILSDAIST